MTTEHRHTFRLADAINGAAVIDRFFKEAEWLPPATNSNRVERGGVFDLDWKHTRMDDLKGRMKSSEAVRLFGRHFERVGERLRAMKDAGYADIRFHLALWVGRMPCWPDPGDVWHPAWPSTEYAPGVFWIALVRPLFYFLIGHWTRRGVGI